MDLVKNKITTMYKTYIGIMIFGIMSCCVMFGMWWTIIIYGSLFLCDIFSIESWRIFSLVITQNFGILGTIILFLPIAIMIYFRVQWCNLLDYANLPHSRKKLNTILENEHFELYDKGIGKGKLYISKNYFMFKNRIFKKDNEYEIKIGGKNKPDAIVLELKNAKKFYLQVGLSNNSLVLAAKQIKEWLTNKELLNENSKEFNGYVSLKKTKIPLIICIVNAIIFLLFMNFINLPFPNMVYIIVKTTNIIIGILLAICPNILYEKVFKRTLAFRVTTFFVGIIPLFLYYGQISAINIMQNIILS